MGDIVGATTAEHFAKIFAYKKYKFVICLKEKECDKAVNIIFNDICFEITKKR